MNLRKAIAAIAAGAVFASVVSLPFAPGLLYREFDRRTIRPVPQIAAEAYIPQTSILRESLPSLSLEDRLTSSQGAEALEAAAERPPIRVEQGALPLSRPISEWEYARLQRLVPIIEPIEECAHRYGHHPVDITQMLILESSLMPLAVSDTDDFGLGQLKPESYRDVTRHMRNGTSHLYAGRPVSDMIFDPDSNVWAFCAAHALNRFKTGITAPAELYAYYARGAPAVDREGQLTSVGRPIADAFERRWEYVEGILPLFEVDRSADTYGVELARAARSIPTTQERYAFVLDDALSNLRDASTANPTWNTVLQYVNAVQFTATLEQVYKEERGTTRKWLHTLGQTLNTNATPDQKQLIAAFTPPGW